MRRLARHYPDAVIAGILSRQGKKTAYGHPFTAMHVGNLRRNWNLGRFDPATRSTDGEVVSIQEAAKRLDMAPSTLHRWINDGFIAGEQLTPGAPWRIRITPELLARFVEQTPAGGRIPDFPVTRSHPPASWPSAANSSICRTYRKTAGEESRRRSPVANRWMRP